MKESLDTKDCDGPRLRGLMIVVLELSSIASRSAICDAGAAGASCSTLTTPEAVEGAARSLDRPSGSDTATGVGP